MQYTWINWTRLHLNGPAGLFITIGLMVYIAVGLPEVLVLLLPAMLIGAVGGLLVYWWRNR